MVEPNPPQVLLEPQQYSTLVQLAHKQNKTLSEVVVQVINLGLETLKQTHEMQLEQASEQLNALRTELQKNQGIYEGDLVAQVRAEREAELEKMLAGY